MKTIYKWNGNNSENNNLICKTKTKTKIRQIKKC